MRVKVREQYDAIVGNYKIRMDDTESGNHVFDEYEEGGKPQALARMREKLESMVTPELDTEIESRGFGWAIDKLKNGDKVARQGWNGKGMWLILVPGSENIKPVAGTPYSKAGLVEEIQILPHIDMYTTDSSGRRAMLCGWLASQTDMLSDDWQTVP
jgi:hypothetical protein